MPTINIQDIKKLSIAERILLAEKIWDSIPDSSEEFDLTSEQKRELDRRLDSIKKGTAKYTTWPKIQGTLHARRICK